MRAAGAPRAGIMVSVESVDDPSPAESQMEELTARFIAAYDRVDFDMIAGLLAMDKLDVTHMCTGSVGFQDFSAALKASGPPIRTATSCWTPERHRPRWNTAR